MGSTHIPKRITISSLLNPCTSDRAICETSTLPDSSVRPLTPTTTTSAVRSELLWTAEATHISALPKTQDPIMSGKKPATQEPLDSSIVKGKAVLSVHSSEEEAMAAEALSSLATRPKHEGTSGATSSSPDLSSPISLTTPDDPSDPATELPSTIAANTTSDWRARAEFICTFGGPEADCDAQRRGEFLTKDCKRKCISSYFGRNRTCTKQIPENCLPTWCRPHYQRAAYQPWWPQQKCNLILETFERIDAVFPGMRYTITLKRAEMDRFSKACIAEKATEETAESSSAAMCRASTHTRPSTESNKDERNVSASQNKAKKRTDSKSEKYYQAPLDILAYWHSHFCGEQKTKAQAIEAINWIQSLRPGQAKIDAQCKVGVQPRGDPRITDIPAVMFLPEFPTEATQTSPSSSQGSPSSTQKRKAGYTGGASTKKARGSP